VASARPNFRPRPARLSLRSLASDTAGVALMEITLFLPILVFMSVAIIDFGLYFSYSIQVENAAQAAAQWAITNATQNGYSSGSLNTIKTAGQQANKTPLPSVYTAISVSTPTLYCGCPSNVTQAAWTTSCALGIPAGTLCSDGSNPGTYVRVVASGTFRPFSKYGSFFPSFYSVSSTATVRVQ
jgi:Flp pilus assembly protein TadG